MDGQSFEDIEAYGVERWLDELARKLKSSAGGTRKRTLRRQTHFQCFSCMKYNNKPLLDPVPL